jgi:SEC-C motif
MAVDQHLVDRSGDLKRELLAFMEMPRFSREVREALHERFGEVVAGSDAELADFLDNFMMRHRLDDGRTVLEHFVAAHPDLPEAEREMLLGWLGVVEGIFEVQRPDGDALVVLNLVDEMEYRVHSNMGPRVFRQTPDRSFLIARLVPIGDEWLVSGYLRTLPARDQTDAYRLALDLSMRQPSLALRNPEKLEQAWKLQREDRGSFIEFFGTDLMVLAGHEVADRMDAYYRYLMYEVRDAEGRSAVDRGIELYGTVPPVPTMQLPANLLASRTVGLIYDEIDGLNFLNDFGIVQEAFAEPDRLAEPRYRDVVRSYLKDPSISPRLLQRLAEQDLERASRVFQRVLKRPRFSWEHDGQALLHRYKRSYFKHPVLPAVTPVSEKLSRAQLARAPAGDAPAAEQRPGRNDPCTCGSGKKYKHCHGR